MLLRLGHSPDSDDAFMFWALAQGHVSAPGLEFEHILQDIETLNRRALDGELECTAVSAHAYAHVAARYSVLTHGASMGDGYGPKVISARLSTADELRGMLIAVPGEMTSAFLGLRLWWHGCIRPEPEAAGGTDMRYRVMPFDRIMDAVLNGETDAGLIIHEGQLTYGEFGLNQLVDLGAWWRDKTGLPMPLGVNTVRRDLPPDVQNAASRVLRDSILHGLAHREEALAYAMGFARGLTTNTADEFVGMYVNDWTVDMGDAGRRSLQTFLAEGAARGFVPFVTDITFVE